LAKPPKQRLDQLLVLRGLAPTRARAQALVLSGSVNLNGVRAEKAGTLVPEDAPLEVLRAEHPYVSRGGVKLAGALDAFHVEATGLRCLDVGASTGGFTDCLLRRGAASVVAVDVGYGQLAHTLRIDPRVVVLERTNARTLTAEAIGGAVDLTAVDASFIGLEKLVDALARTTRSGGTLVALVKPQFEVGREVAARGKGVVRDEAVRTAAIDTVAQSVARGGFILLGRCDAVIAGPKGNREAFLHARRA
jgi:23S rRNA (cytidine1920-2'-O)/16S rRNA (cytidine1409-2'-O)-methyltransferase